MRSFGAAGSVFACSISGSVGIACGVGGRTGIAHDIGSALDSGSARRTGGVRRTGGARAIGAIRIIRCVRGVNRFCEVRRVDIGIRISHIGRARRIGRARGIGPINDGRLLSRTRDIGITRIAITFDSDTRIVKNFGAGIDNHVGDIHLRVVRGELFDRPSEIVGKG